MPMAVDPSLMASIAYSTWKSLPSGENVFTPRSYSERVRNIFRTFNNQITCTRQNEMFTYIRIYLISNWRYQSN